VDGDALLSSAVARRLVERFVGPRSARPHALPGTEQLSPGEVEVWRAVASGGSNAKIAKDLFISEATVKTHVAHLLAKLQLRDRAQAIIAAYESGLVRPLGGAAE
jgi:DNA-binding NarL/FixJ family response regulator